MTDEVVSFVGFDEPLENWSKLPHAFIGALPMITSLAELKVVLYILRHTWGYREYETAKHITTDEFANGRKRKDGTRIDKGIGMSEPSIRSGVDLALGHGFIKVTVDSTDLARVEKSYQLNIHESGGERSLPPEGKEFTSGGKEVLPRSEKETLDKKPKKESTRKRSTPATEECEALIKAWVESSGFIDIGATFTTKSRLVKAKTMLNWVIPVTCDEIKEYTQWLVKMGKKPEFNFYENDIPIWRSSKAPKPKPPVDPNKPLTQWEYDWANIQEQQKREAELYGRS